MYYKSYFKKQYVGLRVKKQTADDATDVPVEECTSDVPVEDSNIDVPKKDFATSTREE